MSCVFSNRCTAISVIASVILGVVAGILRATAVVTVGAGFLWATFGIAVGFLAVLLLSSRSFGPEPVRVCEREIVPTVLAGILGTVLTSVILLGVAFAATSVLGSIITGFLVAFYSIMMTSSACLVKCRAGIDIFED